MCLCLKTHGYSFVFLRKTKWEQREWESTFPKSCKLYSDMWYGCKIPIRLNHKQTHLFVLANGTECNEQNSLLGYNMKTAMCITSPTIHILKELKQ